MTTKRSVTLKNIVLVHGAMPVVLTLVFALLFTVRWISLLASPSGVELPFSLILVSSIYLGILLSIALGAFTLPISLVIWIVAGGIELLGSWAAPVDREKGPCYSAAFHDRTHRCERGAIS